MCANHSDDLLTREEITLENIKKHYSVPKLNSKIVEEINS